MALAVAPGAKKIFMGTGEVRDQLPILKFIEVNNQQDCTTREIPQRPEAMGGRRCDVAPHESNQENLKFEQRVSAAIPLPRGGGVAA